MKLRSQQKTVLFVDDEMMLTKWFERTFSNEFNIVCANSVDDALLILRAHADSANDIAVVVTDFRMPGRDGLDLLKTVAVQYPAVVKILASAFADKDLVVQAVNQQLVFRVLEKPWEDATVRRALSDALSYHHAYVQERQKFANSMSGIRESLGFIGHELSAPLATISSYLSMLQDEHASLAATKSTMAAAQRQIEFCHSLITSFTVTTKQSFSPVKRELQSAERLLQLVVNELPLTALQRACISMQTQYDFAIPSTHNLKNLCISSVINNALRELQSLPSTVQPRIHIDTGFNQHHWIRITDNAPGIAPDVFAQLLKKPLTTYAGRGGNGMGLLFCQKVMTSLAGNITIETRHAAEGFAPDQTGTSVYLHFPVLES